MNGRLPNGWFEGSLYRLESGEALTARQILADPRNVHHVCRGTLHTRMRAGDRTWSRLLRKPDRSEAARQASFRSPWRRGPHCKTPGARESAEAWRGKA